MLSVEFEDYFKGILETIKDTVGSSSYAKHLGKKNYFRIKTAFYEDENPEEVTNEILMSVKDSINENKLLNESKGISEPVRRVVRDLVNIVKTQEYGEYNLPEEVPGSHDFEYDFDNDYKKLNISKSYDIPSFAVEFSFDADPTMKEPYKINGSLLTDGTIAIILIINPNKYPELMYDLIADFNDIVIHEIEHIFQENYMRPEEEMHLGDDDDQPTGKEYYMQGHEIPAQLKGIIRVAKLRKQSIEQVISDWFKRSKYAHQLSDEDAEFMVKFLTSEYEKRYGTV